MEPAGDGRAERPRGNDGHAGRAAESGTMSTVQDPLADLYARGLVAQVTSEEGLRSSLEAGVRRSMLVSTPPRPASMLAICCGHGPSPSAAMGQRPIILVGGATGMIGDPR